MAELRQRKIFRSNYFKKNIRNQPSAFRQSETVENFSYDDSSSDDADVEEEEEEEKEEENLSVLFSTGINSKNLTDDSNVIRGGKTAKNFDKGIKREEEKEEESTRYANFITFKPFLNKEPEKSKTMSDNNNYVGRSRTKTFEQTKNRSKSLGATNEKTSFEAYEDRMLPALKRYNESYHGNEVVRECQLAIDQYVKTTLNEREKKQAALPISVFGIEMIEKFYSKNFTEKEEGLKLLQKELRKIINSTRGENRDDKTLGFHNRIARATVFLLHRTLRDKVYSIYSLAAETIRLFFSEFVPQRISPSEIGRSVEKLLPELLVKSGDVTPRIHNMAAHTLLSMAECEEVRRLNIIPVHLSRPLTGSVHPRLALSRLEMIEQLILNHGISKDKRSGLTCRTLAEFGSSGLHHPAEAVRKVSERILLHVYKVNSRIVRKQLPPDDDVTRRNLLYRQLFKEFDLMDSENKSKISGENDKDNAVNLNRPKQNVQSINNPNGKSFSLNNNQEIDRKTSPNFESQLKTIKNFMSMNVNEKSKSVVVIRKGENKSDVKKNEKSPCKQSKQNVGRQSNVESRLKQKNSTAFSIGENETENKKKGVTSYHNFPPLTDSIDEAKARILFQKVKLDKSKGVKGERSRTICQSKTVTTEIQNVEKSCCGPSLKKKETKKRNVNSSGIPIPITGSNRKYLIVDSKKIFNDKKIDRIPNNTNPDNVIKKNFQNPHSQESDDKKKKKTKKSKEITEMSSNDILENLHKKGGGIPVETFMQYLESQIEKVSSRNREFTQKNNQFSESMLASIRENENQLGSSNKDDNNKVQKTKCIFCLTSEKWPNEECLNKHYLNDCPMLTTCEYCVEVTEISGFTNHLLEECSQKHLFKKCCKCQQAVLEDLYKNHECISKANRCKNILFCVLSPF
uniref:Centrosomal protein CEP104 Zn finger domain-containing protein n=1 Tax=Pediculus humanus subsp. corporis TaxID=121224 RepID=A0A1S4MXX0_PEDHC